MEMNFDKSEGKKLYRKQTFCVIGPPKCGKSSLLEDDRTLALDIEGGLSHLNVIKFPKDRPFLDYDELEATVDNLVRLKQEGKFPAHVDTISVDTATRLTQLSSDKTLEIMNRKHKREGDNAWETIEEINIGADKGSPGWQMRSNLVDAILGKLKQLDCAIWIIAHNETKKTKNDMGIEAEMNTIDIGGQLGKAYLRYSDHILNIISKVSPDGIITRTVRAMQTGNVMAGSRGLCLPSKWEMINPSARSAEAIRKANKDNFEHIRSFFV